MHYSLYSRFRGTLLGAALGEMLGQSTNILKGRLPYLDARQTNPQKQVLNLSVKQPRCPFRVDSQWGRLAVLGIQSLIRLGKFDLDDWRDAYSKDSVLCSFYASSNQDAMNCVSTKAIIATVPIALFYHENENKLRQNLVLPLEAIGQGVPVNRDGALAVGYAIAQALTEKLNRADLLPKTIAFLGEPQTQLAQQLAQVQRLLEQGAGLERAEAELGKDAKPSTPIALAFYCFLSTLEDLRLSVMRAAQKGYQPHITTAITGALSGAYNSTAGIPATLRIALYQPDTKLAAWGMTEAEMLELSDSLVAVWSGVYDQGKHPVETLIPIAAIAAPRVIRLR